MISLPWEVIAEIIRLLVISSSTNIGQYARDPVVTGSLYHLCLASSGLQALATPHMYSTIEVKNAPILSLLLRTLRESRENISRHIIALAFPDFRGASTEEKIDDVAEMIALVQNSLQRLYLDREGEEDADFQPESESDDDLSDYDDWDGEEVPEWKQSRGKLGQMVPKDNSPAPLPPLVRALESLLRIQEFAGIQGISLYDFNPRADQFISAWSGIVRLALLDVVLGPDFISSLLGLEHLAYIAFANPNTPVFRDSDWMVIINHLIEKESLRRVIFICDMPIEQALEPAFSVWAAAAKEAETSRGLDVVYELTPLAKKAESDFTDDVAEWFGKWAIEGSLWELGGMRLY